MISLSLTTHKLQVVLGGAITTSQGQCSVHFFDVQRGSKQNTTEYLRFSKYIDTNSTTDVDICDAPSQDIVRHIETIHIYNKDTVNMIVTIKIDISGTETILIKHTLTTTQSLIYERGQGWQVI